MKKTLISGLTSVLVLLAGFGTVSAEHHEMVVIPVELFACSYKEDKGWSDLDKVIDNWNKWADKQKMDDYSAWTLTPYYYGPEQEFDVIWLGAAKTAAGLGKDQDAYNSKGGSIQGQFEDVVSCDAHASFASVNYKPTPKGETPKDTILTFSDCNYKDGATFDALGTAMEEWAKHLDSKGSKAGIFHWYPVYGGGSEEFDFKWIEAHENLEAVGKDYDSFGTGRGFETYRELLRPLISCDSTRAYLAHNERFVQLR